MKALALSAEAVEAFNQDTWEELPCTVHVCMGGVVVFEYQARRPLSAYHQGEEEAVEEALQALARTLKSHG